MGGKLKVSVQKVLKYFGWCSGVSKALEEIIQSKNWQSAWLLIKEDKNMSDLLENSRPS